MIPQNLPVLHWRLGPRPPLFFFVKFQANFEGMYTHFLSNFASILSLQWLLGHNNFNAGPCPSFSEICTATGTETHCNCGRLATIQANFGLPRQRR